MTSLPLHGHEATLGRHKEVELAVTNNRKRHEELRVDEETSAVREADLLDFIEPSR